MTQLYSVAHNAFLEAIRQPIYTVLLMLMILILCLVPGLSAYTFDDDNKLMVDISLFAILMGGMLLSAFTASGVIAQEIDRKTVLTVLSKPMNRPLFIVGKYLGVAAAVAVAMWCWSIVLLLLVRHGVMETASHRYDIPVILFGSLAAIVSLVIAAGGNFFSRKSFGSRLALWLAFTLPIAYVLVLLIGKKWQLQSPLQDWRGQIVIALFLITQAVWLFCALATAVSTRFGQVFTIVVCIVVYLAGLSSDYFFGSGTAVWQKVMYAITPNFQFLIIADALTQKLPVNFTYVLTVSAYSFCLIAALLGIAVAMFQNREVS
jgi:ABC-2 type transport system permease protein